MNGFFALEVLAPHIEWQACQALAGSKKAVRNGDRVLLSPAMFDLIENAESLDALFHLMSHLPIEREQ